MSRALVIACALAAVAAAAGADTVTVGGKELQSLYPFRCCWGQTWVRNQDLVLQSDAVPAGTITKWEWQCHLSGSENKAGTYYNFKMALCHTTLTELTYNYENNYAGHTPVEVYSRSQQYIYADRGDWFGWAFDANFDYDGKKNLIVEVYWKDSDKLGQTCTYATAGTSRGYYDVNGSISVVDYWHHMRLTIEGIGVAPTSLGRVKALYR